MPKKQRVKTIYNEKYLTRTVPVMRNEALKIAQEASQMFAVEQGEIELPHLDGQRRIVCVIRFERIVREERSESAQSADAVGQR